VINVRSLFPYYGSKFRLRSFYPTPTRNLVCEPFARSARYSLYYNCPNITLFDTEPTIWGIWRCLTAATEREIIALPDMPMLSDSVHNYALPQEAKWLIGQWLNYGPEAGASPTRTSAWSRAIKARIAATLPLVRIWTITQASYTEAPMPKLHGSSIHHTATRASGIAIRSRTIDTEILVNGYVHGVGAWT